ncbi:maleylpyruvate isomerase family mycothiol-dependent enzyme [Nocardiopsis sp. N85]|uniref:maleylpyruvate isomerase family mycothiol-dependent enzyme n=1 Tax=Nocardiopsis sp. N85 TaxID=3029400 RepID=UPI00237F363D|nr:maleylpyruvate isomerase family mycothiol-dependent enzyme [Nocardiopsis sp. N85]MDE3722858.1 maleylpyruvate isomerase family mycothiol-dependent enzyme [Nocardiopsis sp. N85]
MTGRADPWPLIHEERRALAEDLSTMSEERWTTPSLCAGLTVREVLAHLTVSGSLNGFRWFAGVVRRRFDFDAQVAMRLAEQMGDSGADTLARFRSVVTSTTSPPLPKPALLGEVIVHGEDIRRPLGIKGDRPIDALTRVAEYYRGSDQVVVARTRVRGLRLQATDGPFSGGEGPLVSGSTLALIMAMTGRADHLDELTGEGVEVLRGRMDG